MRSELAKSPKYESCILTGESFGISILGVLRVPSILNEYRTFAFIDLDDYRTKNQNVYTDGYYIDTPNRQYFFDGALHSTGASVPLFSRNDRLQIIGRDNTYSHVIEGLDYSHTDKEASSYYILATRRHYTTYEKLCICRIRANQIANQLNDLLNFLES